MKYLTIGAGGVCGCIGGLLMKKGRSVSMLLRGATKSQIDEYGLCVDSGIEGKFVVHPKTYDKDDTPDIYDVIIVGVKGYSLNEVIPFIDKASDKHTIIIPFLNVVSAGQIIREALPDKTVIEGVIYISAEKEGPGRVKHLGKVFRAYVGVPAGVKADRTIVEQVGADLVECGAIGGVAEDIQKEKINKFSMISSMATTQLYYDINTRPLQENTPARIMFAEISREVQAMAKAQGIIMDEDLAERNLRLINDFDPETTATTYRDYKSGGPSEIDDIVFEVVRASRKYGFAAPAYETAALKLGYAD